MPHFFWVLPMLNKSQDFMRVWNDKLSTMIAALQQNITHYPYIMKCVSVDSNGLSSPLSNIHSTETSQQRPAILQVWILAQTTGVSQ